MKKHNLISTVIISMLAAFGSCVRADAITIDALKARMVELNNHAIDIQNSADGEGRALTDGEEEKINDIFAEFATIEKDVERREKMAAHTASLEAGPGRQTQAAVVAAAPQPSVSNEPAKVFRQPRDHVDANKGGFFSFGEFAQIVVSASAKTNPVMDPRLQNAPTTYGNEGTGADGGFTIPPEFRNEIMQLVEDEEDLLNLTDQGTTSSNSMTFPKDETTPWQDSGGVQCNWEGEGQQLDQSKPSLKENQVRLNKLTSLVPITEELLADSSAIDSYLRRKVPSKMSFKISNAIINGSGSGQPLGFMNSGALITVAKESGQVADTVVFENITKMWARMYGPSRRNAVWLYNQDIEPQLDTMSFEGTSSSVPAYFPPGGIADSPYGRLKGRPIIPTQAAQTLGDVGDIMLVDLKQYQTLKKTMGMRADVSMHLWFDYDVMAFRFILRIAGQPYLTAPIDPLNGVNTLSPFVALAARA